MDDFLLIIANKKYSSWSMRPWLLMKQLGIPFQEKYIPLYQPGYQQALAPYSPSLKVPALRHGPLTVWDSLAICEYVAERHPQAWPQDPAARAVARSVSAEMHSGFQAMRSELTCNLGARYAWQACGEAVMADMARVEAIWADCRKKYGSGGPWLFGAFSIADAMFAPVATRFVTYNVPISPISQEYVNTVFQSPAFQAWQAGALAEKEVIPQYEYTHWKRL
ncbi:MAG: glutathione S-transferase family protein [Deltaproteobacteria bacterium]|nr:glutathione S-transferase family protein [Deltaproteobacteria bacterium]